MSEDLTDKLPKTDSEKLNLILTATLNLEKRFDKLETRVENMDSRLQVLEENVELRLHDTRPIWQKLVTDVGELRSEVSKIRTSQRDVLRRISVVNDTLVAIQADYRDIYDRVRGLETNHSAPNSST